MKKSEGTFPLTIEIEGEELDCLCSFTFYPYRPARISGPPEHCTPEEDAVLELYDLVVVSEPRDQDIDFLRDLLSPNFDEHLEREWERWRAEQIEDSLP